MVSNSLNKKLKELDNNSDLKQTCKKSNEPDKFFKFFRRHIWESKGKKSVFDFAYILDNCECLTLSHHSELVGSNDHHKPHNIKPSFNNYSI